MKSTYYVLMVLLLAVSSPAPAQDAPSLPGKGLDPLSVEEVQPLIKMCKNCHGPRGASTREDVPVIAGKPAGEIMESLEQFYFYERHCPDVQYKDSGGDKFTGSMCDIVNGLNKQEALALARHFEAQGSPVPAQD